MQWIVILIAIGAGALAPLQGTNAELYKHWQQPIWTTVWVYLSGLAAILLIRRRSASSFLRMTRWRPHPGGRGSAARCRS